MRNAYDERHTNGTAYYVWDTIEYYGDGASCDVFIPEGKAVESVSPPYPYRMHGNHALEFVGWNERGEEYGRAIPVGYLVTITLRDTE